MDTIKQFVNFGSENPHLINQLSLQLINHSCECKIKNQWLPFNFNKQEDMADTIKKSKQWKSNKKQPSQNIHSIIDLKDLIDVPLEDMQETYNSLIDVFFVGKQMLNNFQNKVKKWPIFGNYIANSLKNNPYALVKDINSMEVICDGISSYDNLIPEYGIEMLPILSGQFNISRKNINKPIFKN